MFCANYPMIFKWQKFGFSGFVGMTSHQLESISSTLKKTHTKKQVSNLFNNFFVVLYKLSSDSTIESNKHFLGVTFMVKLLYFDPLIMKFYTKLDNIQIITRIDFGNLNQIFLYPVENSLSKN